MWGQLGAEHVTMGMARCRGEYRPSRDRLSKPTSGHGESARVLTFRRILQILG
jgi:hypothetical protein